MPCSLRKCCPKSSCCLSSWIIILLQYTWHVLQPPCHQDLLITSLPLLVLPGRVPGALLPPIPLGSSDPPVQLDHTAPVHQASAWQEQGEKVSLVWPSQGIELGNSVWERTRPAMFMMWLPGDVSQPKIDFVRRMQISVLLICVPWCKYYLLFDGSSTWRFGCVLNRKC